MNLPLLLPWMHSSLPAFLGRKTVRHLGTAWCPQVLSTALGWLKQENCSNNARENTPALNSPYIYIYINTESLPSISAPSTVSVVATFITRNDLTRVFHPITYIGHLAIVTYGHFFNLCIFQPHLWKIPAKKTTNLPHPSSSHSSQALWFPRRSEPSNGSDGSNGSNDGSDDDDQALSSAPRRALTSPKIASFSYSSKGFGQKMSLKRLFLSDFCYKMGEG